jgi:hypothetical protein
LCQRNPSSSTTHSAKPTRPRFGRHWVALLAFLSELCYSAFLFSLAFKQGTRETRCTSPGCVTSSIFVFMTLYVHGLYQDILRPRNQTYPSLLIQGLYHCISFLFVRSVRWVITLNRGSPRRDHAKLFHLDRADLLPKIPRRDSSDSSIQHVYLELQARNSAGSDRLEPAY